MFDNAIASIVDMTSILLAYQIGMSGFGIGVGVLYAMFDAFIVIWMRKPISRFARTISPYRLRRTAKTSGAAPGSGVQEPGAGPLAGSTTTETPAQGVASS